MGVQQVSENKESPAQILESIEVQSFVPALLLRDSSGYLRPTISFENGISYPEASQLLPKRNNAEVRDFLRRLADAGLLEKKLVDKLIACPSCKGTKIYSKYQCDKCGSFDISAIEVLEHRLCGYIGAKKNFIADTKQSGALICPKCKQTISADNDYRKLGKTFECAACQTRFESPPIIHNCKKCDRIFTYSDTVYEPVFEYRASPKMKEVFSSGALCLGSISLWLKDRGFRVESPKEIIGASKEKHKFDIVGSAGVMENLLLGDFSSYPDNKTIIAAFAKKYDVNQNAKSFVITYEHVSDSIEVLAKTYGISIIVVDQEKPASLNEQLSRMVGGTPQIIPSTSSIESFLPLPTTKIVDRKTPKAAQPIRDISELDQIAITGEQERNEVPTAPKKKRKSSESSTGRRTEKKSKKEKSSLPKDYYFENDFGSDYSDDIYLSPLDEG
jgi:predicted RNA-binding Zn-ribbon protein involved in translation (DUF1610 family)